MPGNRLAGEGHEWAQASAIVMVPQLTASLTHKHQDQGSLLSHRNPAIRSIDEVHSVHIKSRRVWVGIIDPASPHRKLDEEALETFQV